MSAEPLGPWPDELQELEQDPTRTADFSFEALEPAPIANGSRPGEEVATGWRPVNLATLGERSSIKPTLGGVGFVYPGKRHVFSGPQESAKTLAAYLTIIGTIRQGGRVVLVDFEMGRYDARDRLRDLGMTDDEFASLLYVEPDTPATEETIAGLLEYEPALVVIDAAAGAYELQGLDDNKRGDVERWTRVYVRAFWRHGIATLVIDHVVKNPDARGDYAIGSERKVGGVDVHIGFEAITKLARGGSGLYKLTTRKDRPAWLSRPRTGELELHSDPVTHALGWTFSPPAEKPSDDFRPTHLMEKVSIYLELQSAPVSMKAIEEAVSGKGTYLRLAVARLLAEGYAKESSGDHGARMISSKEAFRESSSSPARPGEEQ